MNDDMERKDQDAKEPDATGSGAEIEPVEDQLVSGDGADATAAFERDLEAARGQAAEYLDGWRRAQADLVNQRRRHERERAEIETQANARLITRLLPVLDDLERALQTVPPEIQDTQWVEGIRLIARKIKQTLEAEGVQEIPAEPGTPFDPNIHEALMHEEAPGFESGQIVGELQKGYKLGDRVLRASKVKVAR